MRAQGWKIMGIGNRMRGDDAAGPLVIDQLRARGCTIPLVVFDKPDPAELIESWRGLHGIIVIDAAQILAAQPGSILCLNGTELLALPATSQSSTHGQGLCEAIQLASALDCLPHNFHGFAIVGTNFGIGATVSSRVKDAVDEVVISIERLMKEIPEYA